MPPPPDEDAVVVVVLKLNSFVRYSAFLLSMSSLDTVSWTERRKSVYFPRVDVVQAKLDSLLEI